MLRFCTVSTVSVIAAVWAYSAMSGAVEDDAPPVAFLAVPGVPVIVPVPPVLSGTQSDWVVWGWRPYPQTTQKVTGSDGSLEAPREQEDGTHEADPREPVVTGSDG